MPFPALKEAEAKFKGLEKQLKEIFDAAGAEMNLAAVPSSILPAGVKSGDTHGIRDLIIKTNEELTEAKKEYEGHKAVERAHEASQGGQPGHAETGDGAKFGYDGATMKSAGDLFVKSRAFTELNGRKVGDLATLDVELKTLMQTSAGWAPETTRTGLVVPFATRPIQVADMVPQTMTNQNAIVYMEETTFTNAATEIAEAGTYPEATLALTEQSSLVRKIAVFLPVTEEQLQDEMQVRTYIEQRLGFMVRQRLDAQLLSGNGTAPNLRGMYNIIGIQTQAKGADPTPDAIYKALVKVRVTGQAEPNLVVLHPNDWMDIRLLRTADGLYIWGNPSDAGPERIWGLPVSSAQAATEGTGIVADTNYMSLATRRGLDVQVSNSHGTYFVEGKLAIRADIRVAYVVYRPAAICTVTGI
jgi:HK97 family phage major capsid protein